MDSRFSHPAPSTHLDFAALDLSQDHVAKAFCCYNKGTAPADKGRTYLSSLWILAGPVAYAEQILVEVMLWRFTL